LFVVAGKFSVCVKLFAVSESVMCARVFKRKIILQSQKKRLKFCGVRMAIPNGRGFFHQFPQPNKAAPSRRSHRTQQKVRKTCKQRYEEVSEVIHGRRGLLSLCFVIENLPGGAEIRYVERRQYSSGTILYEKSM
jgi:hypothetical protein